MKYSALGIFTVFLGLSLVGILAGERAFADGDPARGKSSAVRVPSPARADDPLDEITRRTLDFYKIYPKFRGQAFDQELRIQIVKQMKEEAIQKRAASASGQSSSKIACVRNEPDAVVCDGELYRKDSRSVSSRSIIRALIKYIDDGNAATDGLNLPNGAATAR